MNLKDKLTALCPDTLEQAALSAYTTFRIGGPAKYLCRPASVSELSALIALLTERQEPFMLLGAGSDLLVADEGLKLTVLYTGNLNQISVSGNTLHAEAGTSLAALCRKAAEEGLTGLEFAYGIPGSVGGGVYMNAGAYGGELKDVISCVDALDETGKPVRLSGPDCDFAYRHSLFQQEKLYVTGAAFALTPGSPEEIQEKMKDIIGRRKSKQPLEYPSAGSAFKRPQGAYAAALIEGCGLKGFSVGDAAVSIKHAGFIINTGNADCRDVCTLFAEVQRRVRQETGFILYPEVRLIGADWADYLDDAEN